MRSSTLSPRISQSMPSRRFRFETIEPVWHFTSPAASSGARNFSVAAAGDSGRAAKPSQRKPVRAHLQQHVPPQPGKTFRCERAGLIEHFHQAHGAQREGQTAHSTLRPRNRAHFQAAAARINNHARSQSGRLPRCEHRPPRERGAPRPSASTAISSAIPASRSTREISWSRLAASRTAPRSHGAIFGDSRIDPGRLQELPESFHGARHGAPESKRRFTKTPCPSRTVQRALASSTNLRRRTGARHNRANGVRPGIQRRNSNT